MLQGTIETSNLLTFQESSFESIFPSRIWMKDYVLLFQSFSGLESCSGFLTNLCSDFRDPYKTLIKNIRKQKEGAISPLDAHSFEMSICIDRTLNFSPFLTLHFGGAFEKDDNKNWNSLTLFSFPIRTNSRRNARRRDTRHFWKECVVCRNMPSRSDQRKWN